MESGKICRNVAIFIYENVEILDFTGPYEVFITGSDRGKDFNVFTVAENEQPVIALGNLSINPNYSIKNCPLPDILIIPGGWGARKEMKNETIINWIENVSNDTELVLSVCTGALILAKTNLINGLKLTTNRLAYNELEEVIPKSSELLEEVRYVDNGKFIFSAGVSAGIDMSLYVIQKLLGEQRALKTAAIMEYEWNKSKYYRK
ncbi:DJ-1/PfpI family protein [Bacillus alkalicellulosilyticus]|uniref:DJ-1/PfpI family protein n=1 Tax=Alkalihalobacterium alkalicellulosilyticum TaxID=1912214 RepID=UPI000997545C|nr:DJ-1/PfpI family protein [Bacillus alkalicellulosilyticus]